MKNGGSSGSSCCRSKKDESVVEQDCLLTAVEAARYLNLKHVGTIYHMVSAKRVPVIRLSARCIRFSLRALSSWVESLSEPAGDKGG